MLRRSWPKFENQELVRSTGQRSPRLSGDLCLPFVVGVPFVFVLVLVLVLVLASLLGFFLAQTMSVTPRLWQRCVVRALS